MTTTPPGRQQLSGYVMRDYEHLIAALAASRESQGLRRLFELVNALGYDLALVSWDEAAACPTCRLPSRETVGLVCMTCGTDYGQKDA